MVAGDEIGVIGEVTPLLGGSSSSDDTTAASMTTQQKVWKFLEAKTPAGALYEKCMIALILVNVLAFVLGSLFVEPYNQTLGYSWALRDSEDSICGTACDALWFGNYADNPLAFLGLGSTSLLELCTIAIFTVEYVLRVWTSSLEGYANPISFVLTDFFSWVDLASTLPFYLDAFYFRSSNVFGTTGFLRMFRLFRMMRVEGGRYDSALSLCDDVYRAQKAILGTAAFVGLTTWMSVASLYYLVERENPDMIYCGAAPDGVCDVDGDVDTSLCTFDNWGIVDCSKAGCTATEEVPEPCYNLYQSIPMASYYSLLNLFGEFPLFDQHSAGGQVVGTITAVVAVTFFALPVGIIGNGFESEIEKRRKSAVEGPIIERGVFTAGFVASGSSWAVFLYNFFFATTSKLSLVFEHLINALVVGTALTMMIDTVDELPDAYRLFQSYFEFIAVVVFTVEYVLKLYAAVNVDPLYNNNRSSSICRLWSYATGFLPLVDLLGFFPYWIVVFGFGGSIIDTSGPSGAGGTVVKALRLLRIFRFEKYTHAFTSFDDIFSRNYDVLSVTFFSSLLLWVFFGALLYMTERDNPDPEMAANYNSVPNSLWMTLLNLSGESPLAQYSVVGKIATGILGLFATAIFGIPIGILGGGFEEVVEEETEDDDRETQAPSTSQKTMTTIATPTASNTSELLGTDSERWCYDIVSGQGSSIAQAIETLIYFLIFVAISIGALQTVEGHEHDFSGIESLTVYLFTLEYIVRFIGVGADPVFSVNGTVNGFMSRLNYVFSFYSIIDLLAILPYYAALAMPESLVDQYDEYLRMARILRLLKLDKNVPSFTLIDDVIRYKWDSLKVAGYAAITLWTIFSGLIYLFEYTDSTNEIDPVPLYGSCTDDCTMMNRFRNYFDSFFFTGIHLTGDYPITTYSWPAKFVNFLMVVAAVGVVSIPSGLIANGFVDIVNSKNKAKKKEGSKEVPAASADSDAVEGDDWYEEKYRALEGVPPPNSSWGPMADKYQTAINEFLNGTKDANGKTQYTPFAFAGRVFIFTVIVANIVAVVVESVPRIDRAIGNEPRNFFDVFEVLSIAVFTLEYFSRLFCAAKNRESLYSSWVYAQTFFGIVDLLSTAPWYIEQILIANGTISESGDVGKVFRIFRIVRLLQLEDFITAFSKLDNVFRASMDVLQSCFLLALIIWIGGGSLFFIFEHNNPNFRECDDSIPLVSVSNGTDTVPGCYDFPSTAACNDYYGSGMCDQKVFVNMPNTLYMTAVFLGGEWGVSDFTWPGRILCILFCYVGIALYAIPAGTFFDKFGAILGLDGDDDEEEEEE
uniref:Ion transport domain-containing protein n=1 Tax=Pseudo-nitzschia australis TaxID=44445 RepID=A0A7S4EPX0_9STRA|mmetsp:Transcript_14610/g.31095  ORF Transcript_14610/g.31095 Transcript_14610/m.31095 type:complete len:1312 (-) Transcript_14610:1682-5617(-)|eukprot:CAMPEP_0168293228 /NCGR_PEP_ID=MMETSP0142_2-20121227/7753_1 /TAXON_ID=44445 /ORGANISM="Pseudo-nitzschia australis, Strain 10249 10 AB" /LENGTH=1311 /DNA_ID=CAMNT_0008241267 /DNA_START=122 /DNA_END=4057 /DNA_ORIENTATION=-